MCTRWAEPKDPVTLQLELSDSSEFSPLSKLAALSLPVRRSTLTFEELLVSVGLKSPQTKLNNLETRLMRSLHT